MEARKTILELQQHFRTRRVVREDGDYLECNFRKGTQQLIFPNLNSSEIPRTESILVEMKIKDEELLSKIYSINYTKQGYNLRYRGEKPALPYGEITVCGHRAIIRNQEPIMRTIRKQMGELHITGIPMEVPLEIVVRWVEEKFGLKVEKSRLGTIPGFNIFDETRILEVERTKLQTIKRVCFLHGFLITTWYKGCIHHRICNKCGEKRHTDDTQTLEEQNNPEIKQTLGKDTNYIPISGEQTVMQTTSNIKEKTIQKKNSQSKEIQKTAQKQAVQHKPIEQLKQLANNQETPCEYFEKQQKKTDTNQNTTRRKLPTAPLSISGEQIVMQTTSSIKERIIQKKASQSKEIQKIAQQQAIQHKPIEQLKLIANTSSATCRVEVGEIIKKPNANTTRNSTSRESQNKKVQQPEQQAKRIKTIHTLEEKSATNEMENPEQDLTAERIMRRKEKRRRRREDELLMAEELLHHDEKLE